MALAFEVFAPDKTGFVSGIDGRSGTVFMVAFSAFVNEYGLVRGKNGVVAVQYKQERTCQKKNEPDMTDVGFQGIQGDALYENTT